MHATGLDRSLAALDKTSSRFYDAADVIGLIYHNPALQGRLANYPYFLSLGQNSELQEIGGDKEYMDLLVGKASFGAIVNHADTKRILANQEIMTQTRRGRSQRFKNVFGNAANRRNTTTKNCLGDGL